MADSPAPADDIKLMSFEAALRELEGIVGKLESGQAPLAESIAIYEAGRDADRKDHPAQWPTHRHRAARPAVRSSASNIGERATMPRARIVRPAL